MARIPYGRTVKLFVEAPGFPDGRLVVFEIWKKGVESEEIVTVLNGVTKGEKAYAMWSPLVKKHTSKLKVGEGGATKQVEEEKYYFVARIDDHETKSADLEFFFSLDIYLEDEHGRPLHGVNYTITFSDRSQRKGKFENGHAKFEDVPLGEYRLEVEGYSIVET